MPPGRPPKRPGDAADLDFPDGTAKCKLPRLDRERAAPNDFSSVVKSKLQSYTRTGQACDRCKVRKIRCDALPEGCSHCINQNLECYVTDRVTGRTERRGYMQELEREKTDMLGHIRDLEKLLHQNGVDVKPWPSSSSVDDSIPDRGMDSMSNQMQSLVGKSQWAQPQPQLGSSAWSKDQYRPPRIPYANTLRSTIEPRPTDAHIGVGADQAPLSSVKGTTLSILGSTIDIGSFVTPDMDEPSPDAPDHSPVYNKSVQAMLQSVTNINPPPHVDYPPRDDAFTYAQWYFLMIYPFHPVLHKPTFMSLLSRLYDDPSFKPTVAETTMVHLVFASIYLQYALRNREMPEDRARLNDLSNKHYHFALSKFFDLSISKTLYDLQALAMLCVHTMRFPKSNTSNMLSNYTLAMAIDFGLHRAWKNPGEGTNLENELRKRTWWAIASTAITLNGRMGRPMPIRLEDIDADFPELIADELLTQDGVDTSKSVPCGYEIGISAFRISALFLEMFANIYCTRKEPNRYIPVIESLEEQLEAWRENLPLGLKPPGAGQPEHENPMHALYAEYMALDFRITLRHPAACITNDPKLIAENTKICEQTAKDMLKNLHKLYKLKSLDTTWYGLAIYVTAIFSTLVAHWERRHETSSAEVQALRGDMNLWLTLLAETGSLMGCGMGVHDAVSSIIDRTISWIEHDQLQKGSEPVPQAQLSQDMLKQSPHSPPFTNLPPAPNPNSNNDTETMNGSTSHVIATQRNNYYAEATSEAGTYTSLSYADSTPHAANSIAYDPSGSFLYTQTAGQVAVAQAQAQVHAHAHAHAQAQVQVQAQAQVQTPDHNPLTTFATQATQMTQPGHLVWRQQPSGGNTWQDWTAAIVDNQDRYSANALMSLGSSDPRPGANVDGAGANGMGLTMPMNNAPATTTAAMQWPLLLFSDGVSGA
ncbi:fungal-specific transcription factor domain-containing protein [Hypomontagnella monticulosa]|nr:fungal-specific transcription factor domain-containing protein [Hypomontagnella monticulosa]